MHSIHAGILSGNISGPTGTKLHRVKLTNTTRSFTIPVDSAMKNLKAYLAQTNDNRTRSEDTPDISEVYPVVCGEPSTRAYDFTSRQDTLLYVVNFKNDDGFVIMSADTRLPETVIAQIDKGNLPSSVMNRAVNDLAAQNRTGLPNRLPHDS